MQILSLKEAANLVKPGAHVGFSGFGGMGAPLSLIDAVAETGVDELTIYSVVNSYPRADTDLDKLYINNQVKKYVGSHTGTSRIASSQFLKGEIEVDYIPMGTFAEMLWAGGAGLGGVLTPTGLGTSQEDNHDKITRNGKEYLIYDPIKLDVAIIKASKADKFGNLTAHANVDNVIKEMALCADIVIAEVEEIVEIGELDPADVYVPGLIVDYVVQGRTKEENREYYLDLWTTTGVIKEEN